MTCRNCGMELPDPRRPCPRCGVSFSADQPLDVLTVERSRWAPPQQRSDDEWRRTEPTEPTQSVARLAGAAVTDIILCGLLLAVMVVVAAEIARNRSGATYTDLVHQLRPIHYGLLLAVPIAYVVGSWLLLNATPGLYVVHWRSPDGRRPAVRAVLPAVVVVAAAAIFIGVSATGKGAVEPVSGATDRAAPNTTAVQTVDVARQQAVAVDDLLTSSGGSRSGLGTALQTVCQAPGASLQAIQDVQNRRAAELARAEALRTDALPEGSSIHDYLVEALTHSRDADGAYAEYARHVLLAGCSADDNLRNGDSISQLAQTAKQNFCAVWNPVAARYGLSSRTPDTI